MWLLGKGAFEFSVVITVTKCLSLVSHIIPWDSSQERNREARGK